MRWFALIAALAVACGIAVPQNKKSVRDLHRKLGRIQNRKEAIRAQIKTAKKKAVVVKGDIVWVDGQLIDVTRRLRESANRLAESLKEQKRIASELQIVQSRLDDRRRLAARRLRVMYMQPPDVSVVALLKSRDIGELASRKSVMERIARTDKRLFNEVAELKRAVQMRKKRQDELVREIAEIRKRQAGYTVYLRDAREQKGQLLENLNSQVDALRREYDELDRSSSSLTAEIRAYQARMRTSHREVVPFRGGFIRPVSGRITSGFGSRFHPILKERRMHTGLDFGMPYGSSIKAAGSGVVMSAGYRRGYGNTVVIDHGNGVSTLYGHCSAVFVSAGQKVSAGTRIAAVGSTGLSTGPHLHFEVRINGTPVDPRSRL